MAFDTFLIFPAAAGVGAVQPKGETTDSVYGPKGGIEIFSFSWGASNPVTIGSQSTGTGGGKVSLSSFNLMKKTDSSSPMLFLACAEGSHFASAKVVMRKAGGDKVEFLVYDFNKVYVESIQWSGSAGGDDTPTESVSLAFGEVQVTYTPQLATGAAGTKPLISAWSSLTNTKSVTVAKS